MDENYDASARLCRIVKDKGGYGFHLHSDKVRMSQFIHKVEPGSAAELAGVRAGDRILEVNGVNVEAKSHREVVSIIKEKPGETTLLVIDREADEALAKRRATTAAGSLLGIDAVPARGGSEKDGGDEAGLLGQKKQRNDEDKDDDDDDDHHGHQQQQQGRDSSGDSDGEEGAVRPRLCVVPRGPKGYGFHLHAEKGRVGQFVRSVDADSPAHTAGILAHDRIVQVNGQSIAGKKHSQVVALVKARKDDVTLLLVDRVADDFFTKCGVEPTPSHVKGRLPKALSNGTSDTGVDGKREREEREEREKREREEREEREKREREEREQREKREREEREEREQRERQEREEKEERKMMKKEQSDDDESDSEEEREEREREEREEREQREREERDEREKREREEKEERKMMKREQSDDDESDREEGREEREAQERRGRQAESPAVQDSGLCPPFPGPSGSPGGSLGGSLGGSPEGSLGRSPALALTLEAARERAQAKRMNKRAPPMDWSKKKELFSKF